jgi:hypothetical protein
MVEINPDLETAVVRAIRYGFLGRNYDSYNILVLAELLACLDSAQYYLDHMSTCVACVSDLALLENAVKWQKVDGLILEFGVASARTTNHLASLLPDRQIYGFDSFEGLPEIWRAGFDKGAFSGSMPAVRKNIELVHGLFENTLTHFLETHPGPVALLHVDCDLYSSTKTVFRYLADRIVSGTVIVFDEYFNYAGWRLHEYKAFYEFVADHHRAYEYLGFVPNHQQVCVRIS